MCLSVELQVYFFKIYEFFYQHADFPPTNFKWQRMSLLGDVFQRTYTVWSAEQQGDT